MWVLMLEALGAFFLLVFIVWWTMYSGRPEKPARQIPARTEAGGEKDAAADAAATSDKQLD